MNRNLLAFGILALALVSCSSPELNTPSSTQERPAREKPRKAKPGQTKKSPEKASEPKGSPARKQLRMLVVRPEIGLEYDRDLFNHWTTQPTGCDTRDTVLARQDQTGRRCGAASGAWFSLYDGEQLTDPGDLDVDHMIPLSEAWDSGAARWSEARREAFANDLYPFALIAVSASSNRSKSDQDPGEWLPDFRPFLCQYTARWIDVKLRWKLSIDRAEAVALRGLVTSCRTRSLRLDVSWNRRPVVKPRAVPKNRKPGGGDPRFSTCSSAIAAGYGPYRRGQDPEYNNYTDGDGDGSVCE